MYGYDSLNWSTRSELPVPFTDEYYSAVPQGEYTSMLPSGERPLPAAAALRALALGIELRLQRLERAL
jgi:hypothetical protein